MSTPEEPGLPAPQKLHEGSLEWAFHEGAEEASRAFAQWTGKPSVITVESVQQLPLQEATGVLGVEEDSISFCALEMTGRLTGQLLFVFTDTSGLALADLLLSQPPGTATEWGEMERSAAEETTNIVGCAFLNSLARVLPGENEGTHALIPSPPTFGQDFAESLLQFAFLGQAVASDHVLLAETELHIDGTPVDWTLLFIPDAESMARLPSNVARGGPRLRDGDVARD